MGVRWESSAGADAVLIDDAERSPGSVHGIRGVVVGKVEGLAQNSAKGPASAIRYE